MIDSPGVIPSPPSNSFTVFGLTVHGYSLTVLLALIAGMALAEYRWRARGGRKWFFLEAAIWYLPLGVIGSRLYHVLTDANRYFGPDGAGWLAALSFWQGGRGWWGAVAGGVLGLYIAARIGKVNTVDGIDAVAPALMLALAIGRFGNYANQEIYGGPLDAPWALYVYPEHRPPGMESIETYHPAFLYEAIWCLLVMAFVMWADRRFTLRHGRVFALTALLYCIGRAAMEFVRSDEATLILGVRVNVYTSLLVALIAAAYLYFSRNQPPPADDESKDDAPRQTELSGSG